MPTNIKPDQFEKALMEQLTLYSEAVTEQVNSLSREAAEKLVEKTKATAPKSGRKRRHYRNSIACDLVKKTRGGETWMWYVKAPNYRLTHLLVHGHATKDGGRTRADPFLQNALNAVLPEYEKKIEEALKNG